MTVYMGTNKQMGGQMRAMATNEVNYGDKQGTQQTGRKHTRKHVTNIRPCPCEHGYFQNPSFFYVVWPFVHTQTQYQITETFLKTPARVKIFRYSGCSVVV